MYFWLGWQASAIHRPYIGDVYHAKFNRFFQFVCYQVIKKNEKKRQMKRKRKLFCSYFSYNFLSLIYSRTPNDMKSNPVHSIQIEALS